MPTTPAADSTLDARDLRVPDAVRELPAVQGMRLGMEAAAVRAGCSRQTLYSRYGGKRELLRKAMQLHISSAPSALTVSAGKPLRENRLDFAVSHLEHRNQTRIRQAAQLILAGSQEFREESRFMYLGSVETMYGYLAGWMKTEMARGPLCQNNSKFMAGLLLSMLAGTALSASVSMCPTVTTPHSVATGPDSPPTASCAPLRTSADIAARPIKTPPGVTPDDLTAPHPCNGFHRHTGAGCLPERTDPVRPTSS